MKKIAVIGSGISGHVACYRLKDHFDITLYEAEDRFGGHANTVDVVHQSTTAIDTGFIVYNELTYPGLTKLFAEIEVKTAPSDMSFGCRDDLSGLEYGTNSINQLFAQRCNLFSPMFLSIWIDFFKFRSYANKFLAQNPYDLETTLGELVRGARCRPAFWKLFLYPMSGAIWSTAPEEMESYPARSFLQFMINHRMLEPSGQPIWRTVVGGSRQYVQAIANKGGYRALKGVPVQSLLRREQGVEVIADNHPPEIYDEVIVATHSDQALKMLPLASNLEKRVLGSIQYQPNLAILHSDAQLMPQNRRAWAAWNVCLPKTIQDRIELTYDMNRLQHLHGGPWLVTLNPQREINPQLIHKEINYHHPHFSLATLRAQERWREISGTDRIHYCGAYWRWGFHEDGLWSAMRVVDQLLAKSKNHA